MFFRSFYTEDNISLTDPFFLLKLDWVVTQCGQYKSSNFDGFKFSFLRKFWNMLKGDYEMIFDEYYHFASLPQNFPHMFVTLILEVKIPSQLGDFQHISLLGSLYKLAAKVFDFILVKGMDALILTNYLAFLKGI